MVSEKDARAWVEAYGRAWVNRDPDAIVALFTPDAIYRERRFQPGAQGEAAIRNYWETRVLSGQRDIVFNLHSLFMDNNRALMHWTATFTWLPINGIMELDAMSRVTFTERRNHMDLLLAAAFEEWIEIREA